MWQLNRPWLDGLMSPDHRLRNKKNKRRSGHIKSFHIAKTLDRALVEGAIRPPCVEHWTGGFATSTHPAFALNSLEVFGAPSGVEPELLIVSVPSIRPARSPLYVSCALERIQESWLSIRTHYTISIPQNTMISQALVQSKDLIIKRTKATHFLLRRTQI